MRFPGALTLRIRSDLADLVLGKRRRPHARMPLRAMRILLAITPVLQRAARILLRPLPRHHILPQTWLEHPRRIVPLLQFPHFLKRLLRKQVAHIALAVPERPLVVQPPGRSPSVLAQRQLLERLPDRRVHVWFPRRESRDQGEPLDVGDGGGSRAGGEEGAGGRAEAEQERAREAATLGGVVRGFEVGLEDAFDVVGPGLELGERDGELAGFRDGAEVGVEEAVGGALPGEGGTICVQGRVGGGAARAGDEVWDAGGDFLLAACSCTSRRKFGM